MRPTITIIRSALAKIFGGASLVICPRKLRWKLLEKVKSVR